jgi:hypothetical protein
MPTLATTRQPESPGHGPCSSIGFGVAGSEAPAHDPLDVPWPSRILNGMAVPRISFPRSYQTRPGRRAVVATSLADLRGPLSGTVELPNRLCWQPESTFDLANAWQRQHLYEIVLREAVSQEELATWLNRDLLQELWDTLYLPRGVRQAWEDHHPTLRRVQAAA